MELAAAWRMLRDRFAGAGIDTAAQDADILIEHVTGRDALARITRPQAEISPEEAATLDALMRRRLSGEPVHRIVGARFFYGLELMLSPETLEPRPDTEILVDAVIPLARACVERTGSCSILDLGTGTGAIALAALANVAEAQATGTDISAQALETARANAERAGLSERFKVLRSDWFDTVGGRFDIIVSNPPYIASAEIEALAADVRLHDPRRALDGGADGLDAYRHIAHDAKRFLTEKGHVALEMGYDQKQAVSALFMKAGYQVVQTVRDLGGNDRVIVFA